MLTTERRSVARSERDHGACECAEERGHRDEQGRAAMLDGWRPVASWQSETHDLRPARLSIHEYKRALEVLFSSVMIDKAIFAVGT